MKFHPHPPSQAGVSKPVSRKRQSLLNRNTTNGRSRDRLPLSKEESSLPDMHHWSLPSPEEQGACAALPRDSGVYSAAGRMDEETCIFQHTSVVIDEDVRGLEVKDMAARDDILRGLEYFEGRNESSRDTIARIRADLERVLAANRQLEDINTKLANDTTEQQQRLDTMWKENERLKEQAMEQWNARVKADEMLAETRRDLEREVRQLRAQVTATGNGNAGVADPESPDDAVRKLSEEKADFLGKINSMEKEIAKLVSDKRNMDEEAANSKVRLNEVKTELSNQLKRFVALKRSYNKLVEENETIKSQLRGRASLANETWPVRSNAKALAGLEDSERVRLINLNLVDRSAQRTTATAGHLALPKADPSRALVSPVRKLPPVPR